VGVGRAERHVAGAAILPGLVNAHTHLEYAVYAGFGDGLPFSLWLLDHAARKSRLGLPEMEAIARAGAADCLASGVTTVGDCSFSGAAATACAELGLRATVFLELFDLDGFGRERFEETRSRIGGSLSDRVRLGVSPHAPYTCSPALYRESLELGLPLATHLNESQDELDWLADGTGPWRALAGRLPPPLGRSGIRALAEEGLLRGGVLAAHCVVVDDEEIGLLARSGVAVAHCPRSNALLGCGIAPLAALRAAGVTVGLGTDSPASTPSFDLFDELRAAVAVARARERRSDALDAAGALELATIPGACPRDDRRRRGPLPARRHVARGTQHRKRRPQASARVAATPATSRRRRPKHASWEDQLFFARLRVHAKWMFVLLALVFAIGFVVFGVGSGSTGISDALQNFFSGAGGSAGPSLASLERKAYLNGNDASAWSAYAAKLVQENKLDDAIAAYRHYLGLRPRDESALEQLAGLYTRQRD